jgi:hypothetical protein
MEKFKEMGFTICAIAIGCSNLGTFIIIAVRGRTFIYEDWVWLLSLEIGLCAGFIAWGIERLIKDAKGKTDDRQ